MYITTEKINGKTRAIVLSNKNELVKVLEERIIDGKKYLKVPSYLLAMINRDEYGIEYDKDYWDKNRDIFEFIPAPPEEPELEKGFGIGTILGYLMGESDRKKEQERLKEEFSYGQELGRRNRERMKKLRKNYR